MPGTHPRNPIWDISIKVDLFRKEVVIRIVHSSKFDHGTTVAEKLRSAFQERGEEATVLRVRECSVDDWDEDILVMLICPVVDGRPSKRFTRFMTAMTAAPIPGRYGIIATSMESLDAPLLRMDAMVSESGWYRMFEPVQLHHPGRLEPLDYGWEEQLAPVVEKVLGGPDRTRARTSLP